MQETFIVSIRTALRNCLYLRRIVSLVRAIVALKERKKKEKIEGS